MCGRFTLITRRDDLARALGLPKEAIPEDLLPRYNIAPSQPVPIVRHDGEVRMALFRWGLVPSWAKDASFGGRLINARQESIAEKPSFRDSFRKKRCLVVADGFYEWFSPGPGKPKQPWYIRMKGGRPFTFAGLWASWKAPDGAELLTCTIITGEPNRLLSEIHHRMPVILPPAHREMWLDPAQSDPDELMKLLRPHDHTAMEMFPVTRRVNSPANDDEACLEPEDPSEPPFSVS